MGKSNALLEPSYKNNFPTTGPIALLGFTDNNLSSGDLYVDNGFVKIKT